MAIKLLSLGKKVLISSSNPTKLSATAKEIGATGYYTLDTSSPSTFQSTLSQILSDHPDLDCLINNAGIQTPLQVLGPDYGFDLEKADREIDINIRGPMHLSVLLIQQHFNKLEGGAVVMNVSSGLGFVPFSVVNPVYNGESRVGCVWNRYQCGN
jgi:short-subunit dehydrogenase involved in D-alanine esterification of teichoic acids